MNERWGTGLTSFDEVRLPGEREWLSGSRRQDYGAFTKSGEVMMRDVLEDIWSDVNAKYGTDAQLPPG